MDIMFDQSFEVEDCEMPVTLGYEHIIFVMEDVDAASPIVLRRDRARSKGRSKDRSKGRSKGRSKARPERGSDEKTRQTCVREAPMASGTPVYEPGVTAPSRDSGYILPGGAITSTSGVDTPGQERAPAESDVNLVNETATSSPPNYEINDEAIELTVANDHGVDTTNGGAAVQKGIPKMVPAGTAPPSTPSSESSAASSPAFDKVLPATSPPRAGSPKGRAADLESPVAQEGAPPERPRGYEPDASTSTATASPDRALLASSALSPTAPDGPGNEEQPGHGNKLPLPVGDLEAAFPGRVKSTDAASRDEASEDEGSDHDSDDESDDDSQEGDSQDEAEARNKGSAEVTAALVKSLGGKMSSKDTSKKKYASKSDRLDLAVSAGLERNPQR